ncbi:peptide-methionine (S)-S-oxide reductase MsrA [Thalassotalea sp. Y01]|uniref:peptide-methionine (S)-S-oxide reductase MsrA n=1 Tax=Thalassotalea sp. Y01 TaxID=2729613 RepID=UPI00145EE2E7|nr:peptide-methionine (S)-S-oxide reductase MsrA [Thalassotalea sp. Y01]NMP15059.1 peptide-methionine (S)-S-oxide reductase MsrA [Thalassotalea sp. Y01]
MTTVLTKAYLAGGCFWCIEAPLIRLKGVHHAISGYMGGHVTNPSYRDICSGRSGHAEVVEISYDPSIIGFEELLQVFFTVHDPTQLNRQGNDVGSQYRSAIFPIDNEQQAMAEKMIKELDNNGFFNSSIVTTVEPLQTFYPAENAHQSYFDNNPYQPYCQIIIAPKLQKLAHLFSDKLKP